MTSGGCSSGSSPRRSHCGVRSTAPSRTGPGNKPGAGARKTGDHGGKKGGVTTRDVLTRQEVHVHAQVTLTPAQLPDVLLNVAVVRPVFLWGAPGIGKSSLVRQFADSIGLDCVSLLGTQLAPEDLMGVPRIV